MMFQQPCFMIMGAFNNIKTHQILPLQHLTILFIWLGVAFDFNPNQDFSLSLVFSKTLGSNDGKSNTGMNSDGRDDDSKAWLLLSYKF